MHKNMNCANIFMFTVFPDSRAPRCHGLGLISAILFVKGQRGPTQISRTLLVTVKARTHTPIFRESAIESVIEAADSIAPSADYSCDSHVGM